MNAERPQTLGPTALLLATLAVLACGGGGSLTDQSPIDDPEPPAPAVQGYATYAVDLNNRLLLFGSEAPPTISRIVSITGLPILNRIVGIDFHRDRHSHTARGHTSRLAHPGFRLRPEGSISLCVAARLRRCTNIRGADSARERSGIGRKRRASVVHGGFSVTPAAAPGRSARAQSSPAADVR
ncbi:MAG: hypothetical protein ACREOF_14680 [Gemmatimonadales bacterium]